MGYIKDQPWFTSLMNKGNVSGKCANCGAVVAERLSTLDDCYGVYRGRCPACNAVNLLDFTKGLRGYSSSGMNLCLPTDHEVEANGWEHDIPTVPCTCGECPNAVVAKPSSDSGKEEQER